MALLLSTVLAYILEALLSLPPTISWPLYVLGIAGPLAYFIWRAWAHYPPFLRKLLSSPAPYTIAMLALFAALFGYVQQMPSGTVGPGDRRLTPNQQQLIEHSLRRSIQEPEAILITKADCDDCATYQKDFQVAIERVRTIRVGRIMSVGSGAVAEDDSPYGLIVRGEGAVADALAASFVAAGLQFEPQRKAPLHPDNSYGAEIVITAKTLHDD